MTDQERAARSTQISEWFTGPGGEAAVGILERMIDDWFNRYLDGRIRNESLRAMYAGGVQFGRELIRNIRGEISFGKLFHEAEERRVRAMTEYQQAMDSRRKTREMPAI